MIFKSHSPETINYHITYTLDNGGFMAVGPENVKFLEISFHSQVPYKYQKRRRFWIIENIEGFPGVKKGPINQKKVANLFKKCYDRLEVKVEVTKNYLHWM